MSNTDLKQLTRLTKKALRTPHILRMTELLEEKILESKEPFTWKVLSKKLLGEPFPKGIQSAWIFTLKPNIRIPSHYHPNSVQHTAVIKGSGKIIIGKDEKEVQTFDPREMQLIWHVIAKNVSHAVATGDRAMVVFSFHTCAPSELLEIETLSGSSRFYESQ